MFDPALELRTRGRFWHQSVVELLNGNFLGAAIIIIVVVVVIIVIVMRNLNPAEYCMQTRLPRSAETDKARKGRRVYDDQDCRAQTRILA